MSDWVVRLSEQSGSLAEIIRRHNGQLDTGDSATELRKIESNAGLYYWKESYGQPVYTYLVDEPRVQGPFGVPALLCAQRNGVCAPNPKQRIFDTYPEFDISSKAAYAQFVDAESGKKFWQVSAHTTPPNQGSKAHREKIRREQYQSDQ